jgi:hypothetical protein
LTRRTWSAAFRPSSTCDHSRSAISAARRPCRYAIRIMVASRWPQRPPLAAAMSFSTAAAVRYSRMRASPFLPRPSALHPRGCERDRRLEPDRLGSRQCRCRRPPQNIRRPFLMPTGRLRGCPLQAGCRACRKTRLSMISR